VRLLDRYLLRELLVPLGYCLCGFLIFYVAFDLIFQINRFLENQMLFLDIVEYYVVTLPELLVEQVLPVSLLLALLYTLTNLSRYNELTAIRAAGIGLWRLSMPYLAVGAVFGLVVLVIGEFWLPSASDRAKFILERRQTGATQRDWVSNLEFYNESALRDWNILRFNKRTSEMMHPWVQWSLGNGSNETIVARSGIYGAGQWNFYCAEVWVRQGTAAPAYAGSNAVLRQSFPETPAWIKSEIKVNALNPSDAAKGQGPQLSIREILEFIRLHSRISQEKRAMLLTQLNGRVAAPFTCLAVVLIALPFGARAGRHNVFVGVASSIFICFGYFILQRLSFGMGVGGYLPPVLAAWLPNLVCGATGLVLLAQMR
jgi:lipopolysaccharide export system permease protein